MREKRSGSPGIKHCTDHQDPSDQAMILAYEPVSKWPYGEIYGPPRSAGEYVLQFSEDNIPETPVYLYFAFFSTDRRKWSDSIYLGKADPSEIVNSPE
ncbi:MAG: DUF6266 family protein [Daejeonella sp.]